jgi:hypothetical protein
MGCRGVSRGGVVAALALFVGYFVLRFAYFDVGSPSLVERSTGFGFRILDPPELIERFGSNPTWFYLYNVVTSAISVLLAEPTGGVFRILPAIAKLDIGPSMIVNIIASISATALVGNFAWHRRRAWLSWTLERDDRLVLLFLVVLAANAVLSYAYQKEVIMSPAGAFLALAVFASARHAIGRIPTRLSTRAAVTIVVACAIVGAAWASRMAGAYLGLRVVASADRTEWAYAEHAFRRDGVTLDPDATNLFEHLRRDALLIHPAPPPIRVPLSGVLGLE